MTRKLTVVDYEAPASMELNKTSIDIDCGTSVQLSVKFKDSKGKGIKLTNLVKDKINWSPDNSEYAQVNNGKVTAKKISKINITAKSENGKTAKCTVTVHSPVKTVTLDKSDSQSRFLCNGNTKYKTSNRCKYKSIHMDNK